AFLFAAPSRLEAELANLRLVVLVTIVVAGLAGLGTAFTLARNLARPVEQMSRFAMELGQKHFEGQLPDSRVAELDQLSRALGAAAAQLQAAFDALSEEKQRMAALIREMGEGVVAVGEERQVLVVNPAASHLLGLPGPFDGIHLSGAGFPAPLAVALERQCDLAQHQAEVVSLSIGGTEVSAWVSSVGAPDGRRFGAVALLRDVTAEVKLRRLRENFVANVSHELRGPLAALSAGVEAMHDGLITEQSRPRFLRNMLAEIGRLRRLTDNLLELSRLDAGTMAIPLEEFDLAPLCEGLVEKWGHRASAAGVALSLDCPHLRVVASYDRVEEIITNFLDNAVRFTPTGGTVRLQARPEGDMVRVTVADSGVGIERAHLPHIWERFYMVDPARTRSRGSGTGLGLAIVRQLVEHLGGEVSVESEPGRGSTFGFTLVAARPMGGGAGGK
ncbi:MAG TPA: ATP-binding protein, partial [Symbiobacteriaceae bacterium]|nr:ATP-binding protein [Symbiobacteriaceae bacterium]